MFERRSGSTRVRSLSNLVIAPRFRDKDMPHVGNCSWLQLWSAMTPSAKSQRSTSGVGIASLLPSILEAIQSDVKVIEADEPIQHFVRAWPRAGSDPRTQHKGA